jgi:hypothetical protein
MGLNAFKIYVFSTVSNAMDMLSSFLAFMHGYVELNGFMGYVHNSYLACLLSVMVFQLLISVVYFIARYYNNVSVINVIFGIAKVMVTVHNISLIM